MKFAVAFVVGDTEQHDKFCCRCQSRSMRTAFICRHCNCPAMDLDNTSVQSQTQLWTPDSFDLPLDFDGNEKQHWQSLSHHNVSNSFYRLDFGSNHHNIHFATPGESLHMLQLGGAKRQWNHLPKLFCPWIPRTGKKRNVLLRSPNCQTWQ